MTIPVDQQEPSMGQDGQEPKRTDVRESIRYRRRAQDAEQRAAELESAMERLHQEHHVRLESLDGELSELRRRCDLQLRRANGQQLHAIGQLGPIRRWDMDLRHLFNGC